MNYLTKYVMLIIHTNRQLHAPIQKIETLLVCCAECVQRQP